MNTKPKFQKKNQAQAPTNRATALFMGFIILFFIAGITAIIVLLAVPRLAQNQFGPSAPLDNYQKFSLSFLLLRDQDQLISTPVTESFEATFYIESGEGADQIAQRLEDKALIPDAKAFRNYLVYKGLDTTIQDGEHRFNTSLTPLQIAHTLQDAAPSKVDIGMLPGWRIEEFANSIESYNLGLSGDRFLELAKNPTENQIHTVLPLSGSVEGYLAPVQIQFERSSINEEAILSAFLQQFQVSLKDEWIAAYNEKDISLAEAVTMASVIEKESIIAEEMPIIASVIYNRLAIGQPLEMDSTSQYALGYDASTGQWWKTPLTDQDLNVESPFNTYHVTGLPAGPICSPSIAALEAVAFPAETPFYYFRAKCDGSGSHNFSETYDEHLNFQCP